MIESYILLLCSPVAGGQDFKFEFRTKADYHTFGGELTEEAFRTWATEECTPLVREITFSNGEELTEEGLPFIILFYNPSDMHAVQQFTRVVRNHLAKFRGIVNFITADGTLFTHPLQVLASNGLHSNAARREDLLPSVNLPLIVSLGAPAPFFSFLPQHVGKSRADLPILAADTFRHMYLFKNFKRIHRDGVLESFINDILSGSSFCLPCRSYCRVGRVNLLMSLTCLLRDWSSVAIGCAVPFPHACRQDASRAAQPPTPSRCGSGPLRRRLQRLRRRYGLGVCSTPFP